MMEPAKDSLDLGMIVGDIGASLRFYQDLLGLKFIEKIPVWLFPEKQDRGHLRRDILSRSAATPVFPGL